MQTSERNCGSSLASGPEQQAIRAHLEHVVSSPEFTGAPRLIGFLRFVVETTLAGNAEQIKESLIAVEVYGRRPDYNPQVDSTVRVEAGRLRSRLRQYYESSGQGQPIRIELPKGTYVPVFHECATTRDTAPEPPPQQVVRGSRWQWWAPVVVLVCGLGTALLGTAYGIVRDRGSHAGVPQQTAAVDSKAMRLYQRAYELLRIPVLKEGTVPEVPATAFEAVRTFEELTRHAPGFARGWVGLAEANEWLYELDKHRPPERLIQARTAAQKAIDLDPALPEAWTVLTSVLFFREWDIPAAEVACRRAVELNPRDGLAQQRYADLLRLRGRFDEAEQAINRAIRLNPTAPNLRNRLALLLLERGSPEEAIAEAVNAEGLNPHRQQMSYTLSLWIQAAGHQRQGRLEKAEKLYRQACEYQAHDLWSEPSLAYLLASTGRRGEALALLQEMERQLSLGRPRYKAIALVHLGLGNRDKALDWLERGYAERDSGILFTDLDWRFQELRSEPRYRALVARIQGTSDPSGSLALLERIARIPG